ncbi:glucosaminidase domain-containing protein [Aliivibrio sifiae]|uniref:Glucosaminidase n=1 Tax=Aliivibrio sifiae TaxID=566293 RepID=A0A2S7XDJ9_9GAMM|nr:glucosaminidase domain-containing protein [Aliivibrio sifiae]PQJ89195.1 glucosaminidase [Aliivibrio sifiae]
MIKKILILSAVLMMSACTPKENVPDFKAFTDVKEKKAAFFNFMYPAVITENTRVKEERTFLESLVMKLDNDADISTKELEQATKLSNLYKEKLTDAGITSGWVNAMLVKVDYIPAPLVLSQGANESAWGTSRFAREANNYFGQWCYTKGCGVVPSKRNEGAVHEVAKFNSSQDAVHAYFRNVNRNNAYADLRIIRAKLHSSPEALTPEQEANALAHGLIRYSERGEAYVEEIQAMIRHNSQYWR